MKTFFSTSLFLVCATACAPTMVQHGHLVTLGEMESPALQVDTGGDTTTYSRGRCTMRKDPTRYTVIAYTSADTTLGPTSPLAAAFVVLKREIEQLSQLNSDEIWMVMPHADVVAASCSQLAAEIPDSLTRAQLQKIILK